jgi:hypothetical protein
MVVAEVLTGISLLKSATEAIKNAIDTGKEATGIMKLVHQCFAAEQQIQKQRGSTVGVKDQLGMENVVQQQIDLKLAEEMMSEVRSLCNLRFGPTFWSDCIAARNKAIEEEKARQKRKAIKAKQDAQELRKGLFTLFCIIMGAGIIFMVFALYQKAFSKEYTRNQLIHQGQIKKKVLTTCRLFAQDLKDSGTRWCFYQTRVGFKRLYSTITQDSVVKCQREFKCIISKLTDSPPKEVNDTMKNLNKGFK